MFVERNWIVEYWIVFKRQFLLNIRDVTSAVNQDAANKSRFHIKKRAERGTRNEKNRAPGSNKKTPEK